MNKEEILKELNKLFPDEPVDRLNRVIDTYNFIFASLYEVGLCNDKFYVDKWNHLDIHEFQSLLNSIIKLDKVNGLNKIDVSTLIAVTSSNISTIDVYIMQLTKIEEVEEKDKEFKYFYFFNKAFYVIYERDKDEKIDKSSLVSDNEKTIIKMMKPIYRQYRYIDDENEYEISSIIPIAYNYFKYHNMFDNNYDDITNFLDRVNIDKDYIISKYELNKVKELEDKIVIFESYYNDTKNKRIILK